MGKTIQIFTDGACSGNPGPGGFGVIIKTQTGSGVLTHEYSAAYSLTTNNRMELLGVIYALEQVGDNSAVEIVTDSKYVCDAINKKWIHNWMKNGWKTSAKTPVANKDLWSRYIKAADGKAVTFHWVEGHNGHPENERCDELAVSAYMSTPTNDMLEDGGYLVSVGYEHPCTLRKSTLTRNEVK